MKLSIILLACGPDRLLKRAAESLARQTLTGVEVVAVHDRPDDSSAGARLRAAGFGGANALVAARGLGPAGMRNAGVRRSVGRYFAIVDGSEALAAGYFDAACDALERDGEAAFATCRPEHAPPGGLDAGPGGRVTAVDLAASPWAAASATVIRRSAFDAAGGFFETLPPLVDWELLLKIESLGGTGVRLAPSLASRFPRDDVRLREALRPEHYLPSIRRIVQKHQQVFEAHGADALVGRERGIRALWTRERDLIARRDAARVELDELVRELNGLGAELAGHGCASTEWDDLRRTTPASRNWGLDRGRPIDRHYIEGFVARHAGDIRGRVLEVLDDGLTRRFGGDRVERSDVLDIDTDNRRATVIADLRDAHQVPGDSYDCFILTQTLHVIDEIEAAISEAHRILRPGGVLLATLPCLSMIAPDGGPGADYWRMTEAGARVLFERVFSPELLETGSRGNVLAAIAFLHGLSCDEVEARELDEDDPAYPMVVTVRAVKEGGRAPAVATKPASRSAILLYHRVASVPHDVHGISTPPAAFRAQLESIARSFEVVPLAALAEACVHGAPPEHAVALTFDDGYLDNLETVLPVLEELHLPATFFLTAERASDPRRFWWDVLEEIFFGAGSLPARLSVRVDGTPRTLECDGADARRGSHDALYSVLKVSLPATRDDLLRQVCAAAGRRSGPCSSDRPMTEQEIRALAASPLVEIGAHGFHHLALPALSRDDLHREVFDCRSALERIARRPVTSFAYPYGDVSPASVDCIASADLRCAVTCEPRALRPHERRFLLPRLEPGDFQAWADGANQVPS